MPQLLIVTDLPEAGGKVVYRERVVASDFESRHFTGQLAERVGWAVRDADELAAREAELVEAEPVEPAEPVEVEQGGQEEPAPPGLTAVTA